MATMPINNSNTHTHTHPNQNVVASKFLSGMHLPPEMEENKEEEMAKELISQSC